MLPSIDEILRRAGPFGKIEGEAGVQESSRDHPTALEDELSLGSEDDRAKLGHPAHRDTLAALVPVLIGDAEEGLFAPGTAFSRQRVEGVFREAVGGATDAPSPQLAEALGRLLCLAHLAVILWWLLDKSPEQHATTGLLVLLERALPLAAFTLRLPPVRGLVVEGAELASLALLGDPPYR